MSDAKKCDRCGELFAQYIVEQVRVPMGRPHRYQTYTVWDLCTDCYNQFNLFISGGEVDGYRAKKCEGTD